MDVIGTEFSRFRTVDPQHPVWAVFPLECDASSASNLVVVKHGGNGEPGLEEQILDCHGVREAKT